MKQFLKAALVAVVVLGFCRYARAADTTVSANLVAGDTGADIASAFDAQWSQGGEFLCSVSGDTLIVDDTTGDCDEPQSRYKFEPDGGQVEENHTADLRVECSSPLAASFNLDGLGFVTLAIGPNVFVSGQDTITINFTLPPPPPPIPTVPAWALVTLGALVLCMGVLLLGRGRVV